MKKYVPAAAFALFICLASLPLMASEGAYSENQIKDFLFRLMNFAAFLIVLIYAAKKPVTNYFRERGENIARNLEYLETQARNLEEQKEIMNKQIAGIASERDAILAQYERLGQKEADRIIAEAARMAENLIQKTNDALLMETKTARQELLAEIVKLSTAAARELIQKNITAEDHNRLTDEFMAQVEKLPSPKLS
jgi:F0F1-type ATP synthase membrane subunit b/b'